MISSEPKRSMVALTRACGNAGSVTSPACEAASGSMDAVSAAGSASRSFTITEAPYSPSFCAMARPMPRPAPVTSAVFESRVKGMVYGSSLSQQIFELDLSIGLGVAILHHYGSIDGNAPILAGAAGDGAGAG